MKLKHLATLLASVALLFTACTTTDSAGNTVPDTVRNQRIADSVTTGIAEVVRPIVKNNPKTAQYFAQVAAVFCKMKTEGKFSPIQLEATLNLIPVPSDIQPGATSIKNAIVLVIKGAYNGGIDQTLDKDKFGGIVAQAGCDGITTGLHDAGL